jgi:hypothetical protein
MEPVEIECFHFHCDRSFIFLSANSPSQDMMGQD